MIDVPSILRSTAQRTACIHLVIPRNDIGAVMGPSIREVISAVTAQGLTPTGPWFTHHRRRPTDSFDCAICVPISAPVKPIGRVVNGELPAATVARTIYHGAYEGLAGAWGEFRAWITAQGHTPRPDLWECYAQGPESDPDPATWRTELNQPLTERAS